MSKSSVSDEEFMHQYDDTTIYRIFGSHLLIPSDSFRWNDGMLLQDIASITLVVKGTDENGEAHEFSGTIELSQEIVSEDPAAAIPVQVYTVITIVPAENPVSPTENEDFDGGAGWFYALVTTNTGDTNVTITSLKGLQVHSENREVFTDNYSDDLIKNVFGGNILVPGRPSALPTACPYRI